MRMIINSVPLRSVVAVCLVIATALWTSPAPAVAMPQDGPSGGPPCGPYDDAECDSIGICIDIKIVKFCHTMYFYYDYSNMGEEGT